MSGAVDDDPSVRALSFGSVADTYDRYRPGPPDQAVAWVLPARAAAVVDVGAGTGALTRRLLEWVTDRVVAVEPDPRMLQVLARRSPTALAVRARAEALPLATGAFDAVVVSSAWHWMDPGPTVAEVARVLRPGGQLGVLWNGPDRDVAWVGTLLASRWSPGRGGRRRHELELPEGAPFSSPEQRVVTWEATVTADELVGLAGTYSGCIVRDDGDRRRVLDQVGELAAAQLQKAGSDALRVPMSCRCWRAVRR